VGDKLIVTYQRQAAHELAIFDQSGTFEATIPLPGLGCVQVFGGRRSDADVIWSFTNFTMPRTIYRYDIGTRAISTLVQPAAPFEPEDFVTVRASCRSEDGTHVPLLLVHHKGLALDGSHPSLLFCYGGNGVAMMPAFDPLLVALLEYGVVYAVACLRGGGEYGETWHHAGWREHKQNVFDDCIAAAEWLQAKGYTSNERAALAGSSNGGLTVGAVMLQRPELFRVALLDGAVLDMLRYQEFTVGWAWTVEYGSSEDPGMFPILLRYSPLHNIKRGVSYPATIVSVSEHDDRVVPAHSFKFIATLQDLGAGPNPYLIRIDTKSGHGPVSLPKLVDERVDLYAFLLRHTGVEAPAMPVAHLDSSAPRVAATPIDSVLRPA
jgi:prolyl oligopeptidase